MSEPYEPQVAFEWTDRYGARNRFVMFSARGKGEKVEFWIERKDAEDRPYWERESDLALSDNAAAWLLDLAGGMLRGSDGDASTGCIAAGVE
jgi:hypothetical protein